MKLLNALIIFSFIIFGSSLYAKEYDEITESQAKKKLKTVMIRYEAMKKSELYDKIAPKVMSEIEDLLKEAKSELRDEEWNTAGWFVLKAEVWLNTLKKKEELAGKKSEYTRVTGKK